jgi:hypothetical protein
LRTGLPRFTVSAVRPRGIESQGAGRVEAMARAVIRASESRREPESKEREQCTRDFAAWPSGAPCCSA